MGLVRQLEFLFQNYLWSSQKFFLVKSSLKVNEVSVNDVLSAQLVDGNVLNNLVLHLILKAKRQTDLMTLLTSMTFSSTPAVAAFTSRLECRLYSRTLCEPVCDQNKEYSCAPPNSIIPSSESNESDCFLFPKI